MLPDKVLKQGIANHDVSQNPHFRPFYGAACSVNYFNEFRPLRGVFMSRPERLTARIPRPWQFPMCGTVRETNVPAFHALASFETRLWRNSTLRTTKYGRPLIIGKRRAGVIAPSGDRSAGRLSSTQTMPPTKWGVELRMSPYQGNKARNGFSRMGPIFASLCSSYSGCWPRLV